MGTSGNCLAALLQETPPLVESSARQVFGGLLEKGGGKGFGRVLQLLWIVKDLNLVCFFVDILLAGVGDCGCKDNEPLKITDRSRFDRLVRPTQNTGNLRRSNYAARQHKS
jgi:hypothetical protein